MAEGVDDDDDGKRMWWQPECLACLARLWSQAWMLSGAVRTTDDIAWTSDLLLASVRLDDLKSENLGL